MQDQFTSDGISLVSCEEHVGVLGSWGHWCLLCIRAFTLCPLLFALPSSGFGVCPLAAALALNGVLTGAAAVPGAAFATGATSFLPATPGLPDTAPFGQQQGS